MGQKHFTTWQPDRLNVVWIHNRNAVMLAAKLGRVPNGNSRPCNRGFCLRHQKRVVHFGGEIEMLWQSGQHMASLTITPTETHFCAPPPLMGLSTEPYLPNGTAHYTPICYTQSGYLQWIYVLPVESLPSSHCFQRSHCLKPAGGFPTENCRTLGCPLTARFHRGRSNSWERPRTPRPSAVS